MTFFVTLLRADKADNTALGQNSGPRRAGWTASDENASLPQALNDKDAAIVTLAFALPAGLSADKQLLVEGKDSAYYNVLAVKAGMKDDPRVQKLYKILTSQDMKDFLQTKFKGLVVPAS